MNMKRNLAIVLAVVLLLKISLILYFKTYAHPVTWEFEGLINNMLSGKGFVYRFLGTDYRSLNTPLYSFISLAIYLFTNHSYFAVLLLQSLVTIFLALAIFEIAKAIFGEKVGFIAATLTALHPGYMYYDAFNLLPLSIDALFITLTALLFLKFKDKPDILRISAIGGLIGLGTLNRGILGSLLPFLSVYFALFTKHIARKKIKYILILWVAAFLMITPWLIRNFIVHKEFVFISSTSGENLYRGNNPGASGTSLTAQGRSVRQLWPKEVIDKISGMDEIGQKKFLQGEALRFIKNNPLAFIKLYLKKCYYFWWFSPQSGLIYPKIYLTIYKYIYLALIAFSIFGAALALLFKGKTIRNNAFLLMFIFISVCLTQSLFYVEGRHRWLIEPLLIIFFSYGASESYKFFMERIKKGLI